MTPQIFDATDPGWLIQFVTRHPTVTAVALIALGTTLASMAAATLRTVLKSAKQAVKDIAYIKQIQGVQAENHLKTIERNTGETRDAVRDLVVYLKTKAEDGRL